MSEKIEPKDRLFASLCKGLDGGDWILITWLVDHFLEVSTAFWVVVWVQFVLSTIYNTINHYKITKD